MESGATISGLSTGGGGLAHSGAAADARLRVAVVASSAGSVKLKAAPESSDRREAARCNAGCGEAARWRSWWATCDGDTAEAE